MAHAEKIQHNKSQMAANAPSQLQAFGGQPTFQFADNRPEAISQRKLKALIESRPQTNFIQRYSDREVINPSRFPAAQFLFGKRKDESTATTGVHNYAAILGTWDWDRSAGNGHAELKLLTRWKPNDFGDEIQMVSEFKPCSDCKSDIERFESEHGVSVKVHYLINYEYRGDGDKDAVRELYKTAGWLDGGGDFTYRVIV